MMSTHKSSCHSTTSCSSRSRLSKMHSPYPYVCCCFVLSLVTGSDCQFKPVVYPARVTDQCGQQAAILNDQLMETLQNIQRQLSGAATMILINSRVVCSLLSATHGSALHVGMARKKMAAPIQSCWPGQRSKNNCRCS